MLNNKLIFLFMSDLNSVHLQDYPDVSNIKFDNELVDEMDLVKEICSVALFLRDRENLRVRLPLNQIKIIGKDLDILEKYQDIIADEVNVKNVIIESDIDRIATFIIEVDLKKLGFKYGEKLRDIMKAVKDNKWKKIEDNKVEIGNVILEQDEYFIRLKPKKENKNIQALSNNKALVELDFTITPELELEGLARDLIRIIQQNRKDANLILSDRIKLSLKTSSPKLIKAIEDNIKYIKTQTLSKELKIVDSMSEEFSFGEEINGEFINIGFSVLK